MAAFVFRPLSFVREKSDRYSGHTSTPPGGGVHGMCGSHDARSAERWLAR